MRFVCWLWQGRGFWKPVARYDARHVAMLASMLRRHGGHSLTCVHDDVLQLPDEIDQVVMPRHVAALPDYQPKLWAWSREVHGLIGERFASIDLDAVITGDLGPLLDTADRFRIWDHAARESYNSSLFVLEPGYGHEVWDLLSPLELGRAKAQSDYWTGDQSWIGYVLGPGKPTFGEADGVIQYRPKLHRGSMPPGLLAGFMCGPYEPFSEAEASQWVKEAYQ